MTRPSVALARLEDRLAALAQRSVAALRRRPEVAFEVALMLGICAEIWIGVVRSAALYTRP